MSEKSLDIAVIGSGIAGLGCAWLLSRRHRVSLFEKDDRFGGHSNTAVVADGHNRIPVDTGFIVFNPETYPNLVALFDHLGVPVSPTEMSFAVSMGGGRFEYSGSGLAGLFAQPSNLANPRFWRMLTDILRFYRNADGYEASLNESIALGELLDRYGYSEAFRQLHLLPMSAAIWSSPARRMLEYPALGFLRFCRNHGLLKIFNRPCWHTVRGGSRVYVQRMLASIGETAYDNRAVRRIRRLPGKVELIDWQGEARGFDEVVLACHADQALRLLADPSDDERRVLSAFSFERNRAILHSDPRLMPRRRGVWSSWNYLGMRDPGGDTRLSVSYWMNRLQNLSTRRDLIVTLNPVVEPREGSVHASYLYDHPIFDVGTSAAQRELWLLQGRQHIWYCGAWCGYGFHEDGLQAGLAVAEALGGLQRPWAVDAAQSRLPGTVAIAQQSRRRAA